MAGLKVYVPEEGEGKANVGVIVDEGPAFPGLKNYIKKLFVGTEVQDCMGCYLDVEPGGFCQIQNGLERIRSEILEKLSYLFPEFCSYSEAQGIREEQTPGPATMNLIYNKGKELIEKAISGKEWNKKVELGFPLDVLSPEAMIPNTVNSLNSNLRPRVVRCKNYGKV